MDENNKRRRGRPVKTDARHNYIGIRLSDKEFNRVRTISDMYDVSLNESIRIALNQYYEKLF